MYFLFTHTWVGNEEKKDNTHKDTHTHTHTYTHRLPLIGTINKTNTHTRPLIVAGGSQSFQNEGKKGRGRPGVDGA